MNTRNLRRTGVIASVLLVLTFAALAWRAEWIPRLMARQKFDHQDTIDQYLIAEVYRVTPIRDLRSLFIPYPPSAKFYECRIRDGPVTLTSFSFRFPDYIEPSLYEITLSNVQRGSMTVTFAFDKGMIYTCDLVGGNTAHWSTRP